MFQELVDDYRRQAERYIADALEIESGGCEQDEDQLAAARKRGLAAILFGLAEEYEEQTAELGSGASVPRSVGREQCAACNALITNGLTFSSLTTFCATVVGRPTTSQQARLRSMRSQVSMLP